MAEKTNDQEKLIRDAQFRKGMSIAFFNATNVAAQLVEIESKMAKPAKVAKKKAAKGKKAKAIKADAPASLTERIVFYRDWLIKEHGDYYMKNITPVGVNYKPEVAIKRLKATKSKAELLVVWNLLSEDERHNDDILKVAREERVKYQDEDQTPPPVNDEPAVQAPE